MKKQQKCPYCGSTNTSYYIFGDPAYNEKFVKDLKNRKCILGGCCVHTEFVNGKTVFREPSWRCNKCRKDFGSEPILFNKKSQKYEFYTDIVTSLEFSLNTFGAGSTCITITKTDKGADIVFERIYSQDSGHQEHISSAEWNKILNTLYNKIYLHEWKRSYFEPVLDGESWSLEVKLTDRRRRYYHGCNAYPPYWDELKELLLGLLHC